MSIDHIISAFVASCNVGLLQSWDFHYCDVLLELGNEMAEPLGFGRRSRSLALSA